MQRKGGHAPTGVLFSCLCVSPAPPPRLGVEVKPCRVWLDSVLITPLFPSASFASCLSPKASGVRLACGCPLRYSRNRRRVDVVQASIGIPHCQQTSAWGEHGKIRMRNADGRAFRDMHVKRPGGKFAEDIAKLDCVHRRKTRPGGAFPQARGAPHSFFPRSRQMSLLSLRR